MRYDYDDVETAALIEYTDQITLSREWLLSFDNEALGEFHCSIDHLATYDAMMRWLASDDYARKNYIDMGVNREDLLLYSHAAYDLVQEDVQEISAEKPGTGIIHDLSVEVGMRWLEDPSEERPALYGQQIDRLGDGIANLQKVRDNPTMHEFFRTGVFDIEYITACMEQGIDPEMSKEIAA